MTGQAYCLHQKSQESLHVPHQWIRHLGRMLSEENYREESGDDDQARRATKTRCVYYTPELTFFRSTGDSHVDRSYESSVTFSLPIPSSYETPLRRPDVLSSRGRTMHK